MRTTSYAAGNFGRALVSGGLELTALFYLTELIGVPAGPAGTALFAVQLATAAMDAVVGRAVDTLDLKPYRAGPFLALGAIVAGAGFIALYALPLLAVRSFALATTLVLTVRLGVCLLEVPYNALLPRIGGESHGRASIAIWRFGFSTLALLVLSAIMQLVVAVPAAPDTPWRIFAFGALCGTAGPACVMMAWWRVRGVDRPADRPGNAAIAAASSPSLIGHRPFMVLFAVLLLTPFTTQLFLKSLAYRAAYDPAAVHGAGTLLAALMAGQMLGIVVWDRAVRRIPARKATALAFAIVLAGFAVLRGVPAGALPFAPDIAATAIAGFGAAGALSIVWSLAAEVCDDLQAHSHRDRVSTAFGLLGFAGKLGAALSTLAMGWVLSFASHETVRDGTSHVVGMIRFVNEGVPMIAAGICALLVLRLGVQDRAA